MRNKQKAGNCNPVSGIRFCPMAFNLSRGSRISRFYRWLSPSSGRSNASRFVNPAPRSRKRRGGNRRLRRRTQMEENHMPPSESAKSVESADNMPFISPGVPPDPSTLRPFYAPCGFSDASRFTNPVSFSAREEGETADYADARRRKRTTCRLPNLRNRRNLRTDTASLSPWPHERRPSIRRRVPKTKAVLTAKYAKEGKGGEPQSGVGYSLLSYGPQPFAWFAYFAVLQVIAPGLRPLQRFTRA
jgi:hypothetical protein